MGKKGKIAAVVIAAAVLCGAVFAKVEYDKWHAAQPLAVAHAAVAELAERVPEAEIDAETTGMQGTFEAGQDLYVFQALDKNGRELGEITVEATGKNLLGKPLYEVTQIRGLVQTEVVGAKQSLFFDRTEIFHARPMPEYIRRGLFFEFDVNRDGMSLVCSD